MIITLRGADFSASNIGTLSTWRITRSIGAGAVYDGAYSVEKGAAFSATVTIAEGYELGEAGVTVMMGGNVISAATINGNVITISITEVTGNVVIKVPTVNLSTGEGEEPDVPDSGEATGTNKFNPNDPDVELTRFLKSDNTWATYTNYGESGYIVCSAGDLIRVGRYHDNTWTSGKSLAVVFFDANKNYISGLDVASAIDGSTTDYGYTVPNNANIAYVRVPIRTDFVPNGFMVTINEDSAPTEFVPYNAG